MCIRQRLHTGGHNEEVVQRKGGNWSSPLAKSWLGQCLFVGMCVRVHVSFLLPAALSLLFPLCDGILHWTSQLPSYPWPALRFLASAPPYSPVRLKCSQDLYLFFLQIFFQHHLHQHQYYLPRLDLHTLLCNLLQPQFLRHNLSDFQGRCPTLPSSLRNLSLICGLTSPLAFHLHAHIQLPHFTISPCDSACSLNVPSLHTSAIPVATPAISARLSPTVRIDCMLSHTNPDSTQRLPVLPPHKRVLRFSRTPPRALISAYLNPTLEGTSWSAPAWRSANSPSPRHLRSSSCFAHLTRSPRVQRKFYARREQTKLDIA